ncbi:MAG: hypothetical protein GPOALKHO_001935 [Sodalis sp.]|nr:MAG: hypothetical protein GPOALKHO_001935 [Sodalis sp.]
MALAFVRRQLSVTSTLLGATTLEQSQSNLNNLTLDLDETLLASLEEIHGRADANTGERSARLGRA